MWECHALLLLNKCKKKKITPNGENGVYVVDQENEGWDPFLHAALTTICQTNVKKKKEINYSFQIYLSYFKRSACKLIFNPLFSD